MVRARSFAGLLSGIVLASLLVAVQAADQPPSDARIALVIGNGAYKASPLANPVNDARAVANSFKELGFEVMLRENLTQQGFLLALREFGTRLKDTGGVGLFYYAGHGMQVKGANYLIPVDAAIEGEDEVRYMAIDANQVLDKMDHAGNRLNIVILDACRDNPFARSFRSKQSGLAQMDAPSGMLVAFATSPGAVAYDGDGVNGVYTKHLLRNLAIPGLPIELVLKRVREGVSKDTAQKQIPWETSSLLGDFYFKPLQVQANAGATSLDGAAVEIAFWDSVKNANTAAEYRAYLDKYPNGQFAALAQSRMSALPAKPARTNPAANAPTQVALAQPGSAALASPPVARAGDSWTYNFLENGKKVIDTVTMTITEVEGDRILDKVTRGNARSFGAARTFKPGFNPDAGFQETEMPGKFVLVEFSPYIAAAHVPALGTEWKGVDGELTLKDANGAKVRVSMEIRAAVEEHVRVPAGEFNAMRVEVRGKRADTTSDTQNFLLTYWYSPEVRRPVKISLRQPSKLGGNAASDVFELLGYHQTR
jgi:hypothetical protein